MSGTRKTTLPEKLEFAAVWVLVQTLGSLPRAASRIIGVALGRVAAVLLRRLWSTGLRNLQLAFPKQEPKAAVGTLRRVYCNLGTLLAEFCLMSRYSVDSASKFIRYDGLDRYRQAAAQGKGVFILTGHLGAWELSSFYHSLMGYSMSLVIRRLDNPLVDQFVNRIRCQHGNRVIHKNDFARGLISAMHAGETVGILMDTNMTPPQGVFVPFFGVQACTASGLARVALKTDAVVLPGFLLNDGDSGRYILHFGEPLTLFRTGDPAADLLANTALFTSVLEQYIRQYPDQWLWMHRRWKTRPAGEASVY